MPIRVNGTINVQDNQGKKHEIHGNELDFDEVEAEERQMGVERTYHGVYEINDTEVKVIVHEYPIESYNGHTVEVENGTMISENLSFGFN